MIAEIGNALLGGLIGSIGQNAANNRQLRQQEKLLEIQSRFDKDMTNFQFGKQLEMANATSYPWQVDMMKKAGLSVGLLSSKGGIQPTLGGGAAGVHAGAAQQQSNVLDMAAQSAQIKLMNAQADKATAEANKTAGVDTEKTTTEIKSLTQGMNESRAKTRLTEFQADSEEYRVNLLHDNYDELVKQTEIATKNAIQGLRLLQNQADYNETTFKSRIDMVTAELIGQNLTNEMIKINTSKSKQEIEASKASISQGWQKLSNEAKQIGINWFNANVNQQNAMSNAAQAAAAGLNAGTNRINAGTNAARLEFEKWKNDVKDSTKLTVETIKGIGQSLINKIPKVGK